MNCLNNRWGPAISVTCQCSPFAVEEGAQLHRLRDDFYTVTRRGEENGCGLPLRCGRIVQNLFRLVDSERGCPLAKMQGRK